MTRDVDFCVQNCRSSGTGGSGGNASGGAAGADASSSGGSGGVASGGTGGQPSGGTGGVTSGGTGGASSGGSGGASSGGSGGASSGGSGGSGGTDAGVTRQIYELTMQTFTVEPGQEVVACQNFANPGGTEQLVFVETDSFMTPGVHYMRLYESATNADGQLETELTNPGGCNGLQFSTTIHSTQQDQTIAQYPPGVGVKLNAGVGLRMIAQYFNPTQQPLTVEVRMRLHRANPGEVTRLAGFVFGYVLSIQVAKGQMGTASGTCTIPYSVEFLNAVSVMHSHGTNFVATIGGAPLYETTEWNGPSPAVFDPPRVIAAGSTLAWTCAYDNTASSFALTFGGSIVNNEMCIIEGRAITPNGDPFTCQSF